MANQDSICSVHKCNRKIDYKTRHLCDMHWQRHKKYGDPGEAEPRRNPRGSVLCSHDGCDLPIQARGKCEKHYRRELTKDRGKCKVYGCGRGATGVGGKCRYHNRKENGLVCLVDGCCKVPDGSDGMCDHHYMKARKYGDVEYVHPVFLEAERKRRDGYTHKSKGYRFIFRPDHPQARTVKPFAGWILEHRFIMSEHLGRPLRKNENVHHINGVRDDNRIENLELWATSQPYGQRVRDKVAWAKEILEIYESEMDKL